MGSVSLFGKGGVLIRQSRINGVLQKAWPTSLCTCVVYLVNRPFSASHSGERRLFDTLQCEHYWSDMVDDACKMVAGCQSCAGQGSITRHQKYVCSQPLDHLSSWQWTFWARYQNQAPQPPHCSLYKLIQRADEVHTDLCSKIDERCNRILR